MMQTEIGKIGNYYGGLIVSEGDEGYFWGIENYNGTEWEEITKELYDSLINFNNKDKK